MKTLLRGWMCRWLGEERLQAVTCRLRLWQKFHRLNRKVRKHLYANTAIKVQSGPFKGLRYTNDLVWGIISNKWIGTYEAELRDLMEQIAAHRYTSVVDVGCAEGWYAVGLAWRMPGSKIHAFDHDPISRHQCHRLATLNGVAERISLGANLTANDLPGLLTTGSLLICDIEGAERQLLDPVQSPALLQADILVEMHETDASHHDCADLLQQRFASTHQLMLIVPRPNRAAWLSSLHPDLVEKLGPDLFNAAIDEHRAPGNSWFWMKRLLD